MSKAIPFHQAKQLIEQELAAYLNSGDRERQLPPIEIEQKGSETHIGFKIETRNSPYVVVNALVEKIGPVNVRSTMGDLMLSYEDSYIVINTQFLKSVRLVK
ncbi:hypothetical protein HZC30_04115, partial [Candidatus Woesearchaeota archaeon]|nr:hypothetical protein [Candidatus Woesearchaeota archaeon]